MVINLPLKHATTIRLFSYMGGATLISRVCFARSMLREAMFNSNIRIENVNSKHPLLAIAQMSTIILPHRWACSTLHIPDKDLRICLELSKNPLSCNSPPRLSRQRSKIDSGMDIPAMPVAITGACPCSHSQCQVDIDFSARTAAFTAGFPPAHFQ